MNPSALVSNIKIGDPIVVRQLNPPQSKFVHAFQQSTTIGRKYATHQFIEIYVTNADHKTYSVFTIGLGVVPTWDEPVNNKSAFPDSNDVDVWIRKLESCPSHNKKVNALLTFLKKRKSNTKDIAPKTRNMCIATIQGSVDTVKIQTPDPFYHIENSKMGGSIPNPKELCTKEERIRKIKKHKSFILQSSITEDHIKWLQTYVKCLHKQPSIVFPGTDVWCLPKWVTDKYKFKKLSRILQYRTRRSYSIRKSRSRKRVQGNNEDYQCQKFVYEFTHHPKRLLRIFKRRSRRSATANDTFNMKVKKFLTFF